jgi:hypothetical protein
MTSFQQLTVLEKPLERPPHLQRLLEMLTYRRPAGSRSEMKFIRRYLYPIKDIQMDDYGNLIHQIGDDPTIMWSSHTDTVHRDQGRQQIVVKGNTVTLNNDKNSNCLGADCTAGVWMMLEMIKAEVPGLYVFHREEECGGKGSIFLSENHPELFDNIKYAIAFDRRGTGSIITHQYGGRCCSAEFAQSLSKAIGMGHVEDAGGSFTDTANYTHLIGECSNVSIGYQGEHGPKESLDLDYLDRLRWAILSADFSELVAKRQPGEEEPWEDIWDYRGGYGGYSSYRYGDKKANATYQNGAWTWDDDQEPKVARSNRSLASLVRDHYDEVADWLEEEGMDAKMMADIIYARGGAVKL